MNGQDPFNNGMQSDQGGQGDGPSGNANSLLMEHLKNPTGPRAPVASVPGMGSPIRQGVPGNQCPPTSSAAGGMPATSTSSTLAPLLNAQLKKQTPNSLMNADPSVIKEVLNILFFLYDVMRFYDYFFKVPIVRSKKVLNI